MKFCCKYKYSNDEEMIKRIKQIKNYVSTNRMHYIRMDKHLYNYFIELINKIYKNIKISNEIELTTSSYLDNDYYINWKYGVNSHHIEYYNFQPSILKYFDINNDFNI